MPHCSLDFCTIMLPGSSSPLHSLAVNPPLLEPSLLLLLLSGLKEQFGAFSFFLSMTCMHVLFLFVLVLFFNELWRWRSTYRHILTPNKLIAADFSRPAQVILAARMQCGISTNLTIYIFIRLLLSLFDRKPF